MTRVAWCAALLALAGQDPPLETELKPDGVIRLNATLGDMILSKDGKSLYVLNGTEGKIQRLDTATRTMDAGGLEIREETRGLRLSPDGKTLYAFGTPAQPEQLGDPKLQKGAIQTIDVAGLRVKDTFKTEFAPVDLAPLEKGRLIVTGKGPKASGAIFYDTGHKVVTAAWDGVPPTTFCAASPDGKRIYFMPSRDGRASSALIPDEPANGRGPMRQGINRANTRIYGRFIVSPDGRYLVATCGVVFRTAANRVDDLFIAAKVEPHLAAVMHEGTLIIATANRHLKVYSAPDFTLRRDYAIGMAAYRMAFDPATKQLYCAIDNGGKADGAFLTGVGNLCIFKDDGFLPPALPVASTTPSKDESLPAPTVIRLGACLPSMILSRDRKWLTLLDTSDGKLRRLHTEKKMLDPATTDVVWATEGLRTSPDGKKFFAFSSPEGHDRFRQKPSTGRIQIINPADLKITSTFTIDVDPYDLAADDQGHLFVANGSCQGTVKPVVVDIAKKTAAPMNSPYLLTEQATVLISPDQKRLYGTTMLTIPDEVNKEMPESPLPLTATGGYASLSPDGRFLVDMMGGVKRTSKNMTEGLKDLAKIDRITAAAWAQDSSLLLVSTKDGTLKVYSMPDVFLLKAMKLAAVPYRLLYDHASKTLYAAVDRENAIEGWGSEQTQNGVGDLHLYDLSKVLK